MGRRRDHAFAVAVLLTCASGIAAQERVGTSAPEPTTGPGWTITPAFGYGATYDDNISLFGVRTAEEENDDLISTYHPSLSVGYSGRHMRFGADYSGSLLSYRTFSALNRWDQRAKATIRRQETARLKWFGSASAAAVPSTEAIELGGIPFRHSGARTSDGRGGVGYTIGARDGLTSSLTYQKIDFEAPADGRPILHGGTVLESLTVWRHKLTPRLAAGMDYSLRRAAVKGDVEQFSIHATEGGVDYELTPAWTFSVGVGVAYLESTATSAPQTGPAWRIAVDRHRGSSNFHAGYLRSFIPSFGFGGTLKAQEVGVGYGTALFHSRRWYTDHSAVFRDDTPLTLVFQQLPLRSLRTNSALGWAPQPWIRLEGFYARVEQTSLRAGGRLHRNRVGFQVVTSKPMRMP
jgi:hypothetical protein